MMTWKTLVSTLIVFTLLLSLISFVPSGFSESEVLSPSMLPTNNHKLVFSSNESGDWELYAMNPDGSGLRNLSQNPAANDFLLYLSPEGDRIFFSSEDDEGIKKRYAVDADGSDLVDVSTSTIDPTQFITTTRSPDNTKIAYVPELTLPNNFLFGNIFLANADGSNATQLTGTDRDATPAWSPDGKKIAFSRYPDPDLSLPGIYMMDTDGGNQTRLGTFPGVRPIWSPDGSMLAFLGPAFYWSIVNSNDGSYVTGLGRYGPPTWSPDSKKIAMENSIPGVSFEFSITYLSGNLTSKEVILPSDTATYDRSVSWSPDSKTLALTVLNATAGSIYTIDSVDAEAKPALVRSGNSMQYEGLAWAIDSSASAPAKNGKIAFVSDRDGNPEIYVMNEDGTGQTRLTNNTNNNNDLDYSPRWSPDGKKIAFYSTRAGNFEIYVMNANGTNLQRLTDNPVADFLPSWSPDGKKIAFISMVGDNTAAFIVNADGTNRTIVPNSINAPDGFGAVEWSPDGNKLGFLTTRQDSKSSTISVVNIDGSDPRTIIDEPYIDSFRWSPDGNSLVVSLSQVSDSLDFDIYVVSVDGSESRQLTGESLGDPINAAETEPSWSPGGKKIVFAQDAGLFTRKLYIMNADDGSERVRVTDNNFDDSLPDWGISQDTFVKQNHSLTINSEDNSGNPLGGVWTIIRHPVNGTVAQTGFTPFTFKGISGAEYEVSVANYDGKTFHHWKDNGETINVRRINLNAEAKLVARYDTGDSLRGFTPITFARPEQQPDLRVNAVTIEGNEVLYMYAIIDPQPSSGGASETTYKVYAGDYQDKLFDHWEDGSEDRVRTLTIDEDTTITAYYRIEFD